MDEGDYGQDYQARLNAEAIAKHQRRALTPALSLGEREEGSGECSWCGEEIPEARRMAVPGCSLCIGCQIMKERFPERMA